MYWFNTVLFDKADLSKLPHSEQRKLGRRATNYLLLGYSLPTVLDLHSQTPVDYLRALNGLLVDFESFQSFHSPDGSTSSSLSRARIPQMFKRATHAAGGKGRRGSTATGGASNVDPANASVDPDSATSLASISAGGSDHDVTGGYISSGGVAGGSSSWGKDYAYLLTPSLPFDPDFHETFATLCDVLIDCYAKLMTLLTGPDACGPSVGDWFAKADSRIRKSIVAGFVREFEDASRVGTKSEIAGLNKVILGGLM